VRACSEMSMAMAARSYYATSSWALINFMRPDEIILAHATRTNDKQMVAVEGATHGFTPCTACAVAQGLPANAYGDTVKRLFDFVDGWLNKPGRF
jgi:hypothetical protein